jgi:hypothetical protein
MTFCPAAQQGGRPRAFGPCRRIAASLVSEGWPASPPLTRSQWIIIDSVVYDLSKFGKFHPGGLAALIDPDVAGQDATDIFYGLHRSEILLKPAYARLKLGVLKGEAQSIFPRAKGELKEVPYAEPVRPRLTSPRDHILTADLAVV